MFEIDFLPVQSTTGASGKSGDAITARFTTPLGREVVIVVDAGFADTGQVVVDHVQDQYGTSHVDLLISTHPDQDHINGTITVVEQLQVDEVWVHLPWNHHSNTVNFSNLEAVKTLVETASNRGTRVREPFTGEQAFDGALTILGPTADFYAQCVARHLEEVGSGTAAARLAAAARPTWMTKAAAVFERALSYLPMVETLGEDGDAGPRNDSSVITLLQLDGQRLLLTGDAGIGSLWQAVTAYEQYVGPFATYPLNFFQPPHHGSRRNLSPTLLDHLIGSWDNPHGQTGATISAASGDSKHPSPKVTNALLRRGVTTSVTGTNTVCWRSLDAPQRPGWIAAPTVPPRDEEN